MTNLAKSRKNKYHIIYKTINLISNKIYIGAHSTNNIDDNYLGSGKMLNAAIKKYGIENFKKEVLYIFLSPEEMFEKEKEIVNESFVSRPDVYNIVTGGFGGFNKGSKDLRHITNIETGNIIAVNNVKLQEFLNNGWILGGVTPSNKGKIYIYKELSRLAIDIDNIDKYLNDGWQIGYDKSPTKGKIWMYLNSEDRYTLIDNAEFDSYLKNGWVRKKWAPIEKGSIWINKDGLRKRISNDLLRQYLDTGWSKGWKI